MPTYRYRRWKDREIVELHIPVREMQRRQKEDGSIKLDDGTLAHRVYDSESAPRVTGRVPPIVSRSMGVHPKQRLQAMKRDTELGVSVPINERGNRVFENRQVLNRWLKAHKAQDFTGCFKDE